MQYTYEVIRRLGRGAFGEVMLCRTLETGELVAVKRVFVRSTEHGVPDNLVREVKCMQAVDHPNVLQLKDVYCQGQSVHLVLEYCVADVAGLLRAQRHPIPERIVKGMAKQMLRGVAALHAAGVMHRDLKPSNVLMDVGGVLKVADMGLARPCAPGDAYLNPGAQPEPSARPPQYTHTVATRWYRAPELLFGAREYTGAVDVWSLGAIIAELLGLGPLLPGENDIDQLGKTVRLLGSFEEQWPEVSRLPDYGKICFPHASPMPLAMVLPHASPAALRFLGCMLRCNPAARLTPGELLAHEFLLEDPGPSTPHEIAAYMEAAVRQAANVEVRVARVLRAAVPAADLHVPRGIPS